MAIVPSFIPGGDRINQAITNFLEGGVVGIDSIRNIDYGTNFLWTLDFIDTDGNKPPVPFDQFFPASDVLLNLGVVNTFSFEAGHTSLAFPRNTTFKGMDITFYDNDSRDLQKWITDWITLDIQNDGQFMSGLRDSHQAVRADSFGQVRPVQPLRHIKLALLDRGKEEALSYNYLVYPDGNIDFQGSQASEATQFQVRFNIYQELAKPKAADPGVFREVVRQLGQLAGRLI